MAHVTSSAEALTSHFFLWLDKQKPCSIGHLRNQLGCGDIWSIRDDDFWVTVEKYVSSFVADGEIAEPNALSWADEHHQASLAQLTYRFLEQDEARGSSYWPDDPESPSYGLLQYSTDSSFIQKVMVQIFFNRILAQCNPATEGPSAKRSTGSATRPQQRKKNQQKAVSSRTTKSSSDQTTVAGKQTPREQKPQGQPVVPILEAPSNKNVAEPETTPYCGVFLSQAAARPIPLAQKVACPSKQQHSAATVHNKTNTNPRKDIPIANAPTCTAAANGPEAGPPRHRLPDSAPGREASNLHSDQDVSPKPVCKAIIPSLPNANPPVEIMMEQTKPAPKRRARKSRATIPPATDNPSEPDPTCTEKYAARRQAPRKRKSETEQAAARKRRTRTNGAIAPTVIAPPTVAPPAIAPTNDVKPTLHVPPTPPREPQPAPVPAPAEVGDAPSPDTAPDEDLIKQEPSEENKMSIPQPSHEQLIKKAFEEIKESSSLQKTSPIIKHEQDVESQRITEIHESPAHDNPPAAEHDLPMSGSNNAPPLVPDLARNSQEDTPLASSPETPEIQGIPFPSQVVGQSEATMQNTSTQTRSTAATTYCSPYSSDPLYTNDMLLWSSLYGTPSMPNANNSGQFSATSYPQSFNYAPQVNMNPAPLVENEWAKNASMPLNRFGLYPSYCSGFMYQLWMQPDQWNLNNQGYNGNFSPNLYDMGNQTSEMQDLSLALAEQPEPSSGNEMDYAPAPGAEWS